MEPLLPTAHELEKLPMRAVVAYAARAARRSSRKLRGIISDDILENALRLAEAVTVSNTPYEKQSTAIASAGHGIAKAFGAAPANDRSVERLRAVFSLVQATLAAMNLLDAIAARTDTRQFMTRAVGAAVRAARVVGTSATEANAADIEAARKDYEVLLQKYGERDDVVIGDPVDCFRDDRG